MHVRIQRVLECFAAVLTALLFVQLLYGYIMIPTHVTGESMEPSFENGQYVIVVRWAYWFSAPRRGEVIVFRAPSGDNYIKRVIGLPGESVMVEDGQVYINGHRLRENYIKYRPAISDVSAAGKDFPHTIVPAHHVFVMGDNRPLSLDSRSASVGMVPYDNIIGRTDLTVWPLSDIHIVRHGEAEVIR